MDGRRLSVAGATAEEAEGGRAGGRTLTWSFRSAALGRTMPALVCTPPDYDQEAGRRYPVLYMLHGMGGSYRSWQEYGLRAEGVPHAWSIGAGGHTPAYWGGQVEACLRFYSALLASPGMEETLVALASLSHIPQQ